MLHFVRQALGEHLMDTGELLRANALTAAELFVHDLRQLELFPEGELMWIPFQTTNFRNDSEIGAKESHLHS